MSTITDERINFHRELIRREVLSFSGFTKYSLEKIASNADSGNSFSVNAANSLLEKISKSCGEDVIFRAKKKEGQTLGNEFEDCCCHYLEATFKKLGILRPGQWVVEKIASRREGMIGRYAQYSHIAELDALAKQHKELRSSLGEDYTIAPDVVIARMPESDDYINSQYDMVDDDSCKLSLMRVQNHTNPLSPLELIHSSISCKFTMRSDRAQNTRTEALNLIRNRKGRAPHIVSVTAEPLPSRLASLALGTGDMDCVYHFALYELQETLEEQNRMDALDMLNIMIEGKRLKDISDLPLDLCI